MVFDISEVTGLGEYKKKTEESRDLDYRDDTVFLVVNKNTIESRTDDQLSKLLREKYESVMESRYFGRGGIEIVLANQLSQTELYDLVRLSYNLS